MSPLKSTKDISCVPAGVSASDADGNRAADTQHQFAVSGGLTPLNDKSSNKKTRLKGRAFYRS
jgi:hypothetical protein